MAAFDNSRHPLKEAFNNSLCLKSLRMLRLYERQE
jgi:hypothetical protein